MASIMSPGDTTSKILQPRAKFGVNIRAATGNITGNWFLQHSTDKINWENSQLTAFSDTDKFGSFEIPHGFYCRLFGGSGDNLQVDVGYLSVGNTPIISIDTDITDN